MRVKHKLSSNPGARTFYEFSKREIHVLYWRVITIHDGGKKKTLDALGKELCVTRQRVRDIEGKILRRIRGIQGFNAD